MRALIRKHPLASYFALAFFISWGGVLAVVLPGPIPAPPELAERLFPSVYLMMLAGPAIAGVLLTAVVAGPRGLRDFRERLFHWRVGWRWFAVALLTAPIMLVATMFVLQPVSHEFVPAFLDADGRDPSGPLGAASQLSIVLLGLAVGIGAGLFEELGWTGFAMPRLLPRYGLMRAGLIAGFFWGAWHLLAGLWGSADAFRSISIPLYLIVTLFSVLVPYRLLMAMVYDETGSLLVAIVMHASLTASMIILGPQVSGRALVAYNLVFGAGLWVLVLFVWLRGRWLRRTAAEARKVARLNLRSENHAWGAEYHAVTQTRSGSHDRSRFSHGRVGSDAHGTHRLQPWFFRGRDRA